MSTQEITPFYDKEIKCILCENTYKTKRIRSRFIRVNKVHSDFYTEYKDPECNPYYYEVHGCPECGFSASDNFSTYFPIEKKEQIFEQISKKWKSRDYGGLRSINQAIAVYKLGIVSGSLKGEKNIVLAGLCMRLAWLYRIKANDESERRFLRLSLRNYEDAYENSDYIGTQMSEMRLIYLIGELQRRTGNVEEAVRQFSRVISHNNRAIEIKLVEMAREQWFEIRNNEEDSGDV
jgi:uncharacterized protein (DUF2225 family)